MNEKDLHKAVCEYLKYQYPNVLFNTDLSGIRMTFGQAKSVKHLRSGNGFPDIVVYKPMLTKVGGFDKMYWALFIELKREGERIYKKNSEPVNEHIAEQIEMIGKLNNLGYYATFCIGFNEAKNIIDWYLGNEK